MSAKTEVVASVLRLCRVADNRSGHADHGTTLAARWDPSCGHRLVTLFSSGVLRLWDVVLNECVDLALHLPGAPRADGRGPAPPKRSAIGIAMFDFLPPTAADAVAGSGPGIVFCTRRSRVVYTAQLPGADGENAAASGDAADFLSGVRVFEYATRLAADPCSIAAWAVAFPPCGVFVAAVGCADGSVEAWAGSTGLNPENVTGARTMRDASPAVVRTRAFTPLAAAPGDAAPAFASAVLHATATAAVHAHAGRVTRICPIPATEAWGGAGASSASLFCSTSSDGSAQLWRVAVLATPSGRAPSVIPGDIAGVVVEPLFALPTDGSLITAVAAVAWPLRHTAGPAGHAFASTQRLPRAAATPDGARSLLATGSADGAVTVYECIFAEAIAVGGAARPPLPTLRVVSSVAVLPAEPITALALSPPMPLPHDADAADPAAAFDASGFTMAVADASGLLRVYSLEGTSVGAASAAAGAGPSGAWGVAPPVLALLRGTASPAEADGSAPPPSAYDAVLGIGAEAALLERLRSMEAAAAAAGGADGLARGRGGGGTTAVTAVALQGLRRSIVACGFHDCARATAAAAGGRPPAPLIHAPSAVTVGALMAVNGAGEVSLWARGALPGDAPLAEEEETEDMGANEGAPEQRGGALDDSEPSQSAGVADPDHAARPLTGAVEGLGEEDNDEGADEDDEPPRPQAMPAELEAGVRRWLERERERQAAAAADDGGAAADGASDAGHSPTQHAAPASLVAPLRVLQPTDSSSHRDAEIAATQEERLRRHGPRARSPGGLGVLVDKHALSLSAADAVRSLYRVVPTNGPAPEHLRSHSGRRRTHVLAPQQPHLPDRATPGAAIAPVSSAQAAPPERRLLGPSTAAAANAASPSDAGAAPGAASGSVLSRVAVKSSGPYMDPAFRNPARVAAVLLESSGLLDAQPGDGGDGAAFGRLAAAATDEGAHHFVAPILGSAAALQAEIARLEALQFDAEAATRAALRERGVSDSVVVESALQRCRERQQREQRKQAAAEQRQPAPPQEQEQQPPQQASERADATLAAASQRDWEGLPPGDPSALVASAGGDGSALAAGATAPPLLASSGTTIPAPSAAVTRLLARPQRHRGAPERPGVSARDVLHWQFHLRGSAPGAPQARPSSAIPGAAPRPQPPIAIPPAAAAAPVVPAPARSDSGASPSLPAPSLIDFSPVVRQARLSAMQPRVWA